MKKAVLYLLLFLAMQLVVTFCVTVLMKLFWADAEPVGPDAVIVISSLTSILLVLIMLVTGQCAFADMQLPQRRWHDMTWSALLGAGMLLPLMFLEELQPDFMQQNLLEEILSGLLGSAWGFVAIAVLAPLSEEVVFRSGMIPALKEWAAVRWGDKAEWIAIVVSALLFSIAHFNPAQMAHALLVGILLGWVYTQTGSVLPCIVIHVVNNATAFIVTWLFPELPLDARMIELFDGNGVVMYMSIAVSVVLAVLSVKQLAVNKLTVDS